MPEYGRTFSQANSLKFYTSYQEYKRSTALCNSGQSITRPVLTVAQLLRKSIRSCLSRTYFDGSELEETDLLEALAKHAECWTDDVMDLSIAAPRFLTWRPWATSVPRWTALMAL